MPAPRISLNAEKAGLVIELSKSNLSLWLHLGFCSFFLAFLPSNLFLFSSQKHHPNPLDFPPFPQQNNTNLPPRWRGSTPETFGFDDPSVSLEESLSPSGSLGGLPRLKGTTSFSKTAFVKKASVLVLEDLKSSRNPQKNLLTFEKKSPPNLPAFGFSAPTPAGSVAGSFASRGGFCWCTADTAKQR